MEKFFELKKNGTNTRTEIVAGITTFMTMAYILVVNPIILGSTGMDQNAIFTATALSAAIATLIMALYAKYPFALAPGMGLNAYFAYSVVANQGLSWEFALTAVLIEGIIFIALSFFKGREVIFDAIPLTLKKAVSVGIGLFISLIGLSGSGIIVHPEGTIVGLGNIKEGTALLALIGLLITFILVIRKVKGALLLGIILTTIIGIPMGITTIPEGFKIFSLPPSVEPIAFKFDFSQVFSTQMFMAVLTFLFVDMFDTVGTLAGVASKSNMLDKDGKLPRVSKAFFADSVGTVVGSMLGTSTVTTFVESSAGVAEGGRTGLTSLTTAVMFLLALFIAPIFTLVPAAATAPALITVGMFMMEPIMDIDFRDYTEAIPAFLTIAMIPFAYSIAEGIFFGMISYTLLKTIAGRYKEVSPLMWILSILFVLRYIFIV